MQRTHPDHGFGLFMFQQRIMGLLSGWAVGSIVTGLIWLRDRAPFMRGMGAQFAGWGAIDGIIAVLGWRGAARSAERYAVGELDGDQYARQMINFERLLWINAGLDVLYMLGGRWFARRNPDDPQRRGTGWGVMWQGAFLFIFDLLNAAYVRRQRDRWSDEAQERDQ